MRVHHLAFRTRDVARLAAFYESVIGLPRAPGERDGSRSVWLLAGEAIVMIEKAEEGETLAAARTMELIAFAIANDDVVALREKLAENDVGIEGETGFTIYFRDPDGRRIGVSTYGMG